MHSIEKIGLGGGCHWCTEGIFNSLIGIANVEQGWICTPTDPSFSEAVIVHFDPQMISLETLIEIHLHTHSSTSNHSMRGKYRSAVYVFSKNQEMIVSEILRHLARDFEQPITTQTLFFGAFKPNTASFQNYFYSRPNAPFCTSYIHPKIALLKARFSKNANHQKIDGVKLKAPNIK